MAIIRAHLAMVHHGDERRYAKGVHFLARIVRETLALAFFYRRLGAQLHSGGLRALDYEQALLSYFAIFDCIAINVAKLIERRADSWSFHQLHKEWAKYLSDDKAIKRVAAAVDDLRRSFAWLEDYRHKKAAHQPKDADLFTVTALPPDIKGLADLVTVMDMFVEGKIPYTLHLHESPDKVDLRAEFAL